MEPLSLNTRRLYSFAFTALFVAIIPLAGLYAAGYRLSGAPLLAAGGLSVVATGGIHVTIPFSGVSISINGEEVERSNLFARAFFFDDLEPGVYVLQASAEGYIPWSKTLTVESRLVTDVGMVAVPQPQRLLELAVGVADVTENEATSTTRFVSRAALAELTATFSSLATSRESEEDAGPLSTPVDEDRGVELRIEHGDLFVEWNRSGRPPSSFCPAPSVCTPRFALERGEETVTAARFAEGGVVYRTEESGVYFTEIEVREPRLTASIYSAPEADFRIVDGALYVKDGRRIFAVEGF